MPLYTVERISIEVVSAVVCFILVRFMVKPFRLTGETRYLGLPLGFGFLGVSYTFSALSFSPIFDFTNKGLVQLFLRAFAFLFLVVTYYFSKSAKDRKLLWNATIAILAAVLAIMIMVAIIEPEALWLDYHQAQVYVRIFNLVCLGYILIHALKSHVEKPDPTTLMIPLGYILLWINQYSLLIWAVESSTFAFFAGLAFRLAGLAVFLFVSYRAFYWSEARGSK